ncbi:hypothetical protein [Nocardioides sp.]|uniref:hypothetical protein n=1 Tax=Nocardioides sp. TaxID=35761 RepID=UPI001A203026|nr:hypothetical protein [Nocardioides sp.]MBJ7356678.1 hypothetical protein [Nocardioides sp.]
MTTVTTHNPARADLAATEAQGAGHSRQSRSWALAGIGAGILGAGTIVTSSAVDVVYREEFNRGSVDGVAEALSDKTGVMFAFHSITTLGAVLMIVFGAGLFRRLRAGMPDSIAPVVALTGLAGTGLVSLLGAGLDTEFMLAGLQDDMALADSSAAIYNHWIGTIPWLWTLVGLSGLAVFVAFRRGVAPRWLGLVGLVLGGLTLLLGISPFEYMSGLTGVLWLLATAIGFTLGDKEHRSA